MYKSNHSLRLFLRSTQLYKGHLISVIQLQIKNRELKM